uniref:Phospholipase B-like n=1 Tax=Syphacia muris TaxID=451379 RepID=A0A0N5AVB9_9BILA
MLRGNVFSSNIDEYDEFQDFDEVEDYLEAEGPGEETKYIYRSICKDDNGRLQILAGFDCRRQVAVGRFRNAVNLTGWSFLEIETFSSYPADEQAYAAGVLEGNLTKALIANHIENTVADACKNYTKYCKRVHAFMKSNMEWIKTKVLEKNLTDKYWLQVRRTMFQLTGMYHGYDGVALVPDMSFDLHPILMMNSNGEFYDLDRKFNKTRDPTEIPGRCSGLVKVTPENKDLLFSQVTMSGFQFMLRILKMYKFGYDKQKVPGHIESFSSYPGVLFSSDDFVLLSSGLAALETTITVYDKSLFSFTTDKDQIPMWMRAIVANQLAKSGKEWCEIFSRYNSGTYNNQWVVVDYKNFNPKQPLPYFGLLYVLEQLPGFVEYRDMTWYLRKYSYFPSYNIPYFKRITKRSGAGKYADKVGDWSRWGKCPRAKIFERDHSTVVDLNTLTRLMRYNDYTHDEFSRCNCTPPYTAEAAISARGDLNPKDGKYEFAGMGHVNHGAIDYKGTDYALFMQLRFRAISSPAYDNVSPFQWSKFDMGANIKHIGHPDLWKFAAVEPVWETPDVKGRICHRYLAFVTFIDFIDSILSSNAYCIESEDDDQTEHNASDLELDDSEDDVIFTKKKQKQGPGRETKYTYSSICKNEEGQMRILPGFDCRRQVAVGRFQNAINITGWSFLEIETMAEYPPEEQAYAAGVLEGFLTKELIGYHLENTVLHSCENYTIYCDKLHNFMHENMNWIRETLSTKSPNDAYWAQINRTLHQLTGVYHGYDGTPLSPMISYELHPILEINSMGEFFDLEKKFNKTVDPTTLRESCSGLVKIAPNNADLFFSHVTMNGFQYMTRVLKMYKFGYNTTQVPGHTYSFSSYPGMIYSSDDFLLTSAGNSNPKHSLSFSYPILKIPMWIRVKNANELARDGEQWCDIFSLYNSGTYNNQWLVVDYKNFKPGKPIPDTGLLYVLEQLPSRNLCSGYIVYRDLTDVLKRKTYFPSYNIPWFSSITKRSGLAKHAKKYGNWFRWGKCPRARIFERDHHKVVDIDTLTELMRYNDYKHDEFSRCNCTPPYTAEAAISARGDLNLPDGKYEFQGMGHVNHGALDYKARIQFRPN